MRASCYHRSSPLFMAAATSLAVLLQAVAALLVMALQLAAAASARPPAPIGLPNCNTTCGNVSVPYPFGFGPSRCYSPGFNLTCDASHDTPRLLLGDGTLRVTDISTFYGTVRVIRTGSIINASGDFTSGRWKATFGRSFTDYGYLLSPNNELVVYGCNVEATLRGNIISTGSTYTATSGCFTYCSSFGTHSNASLEMPVGSEGWCRGSLPHVSSPPCAIRPVEVLAKWLYGGNHTLEQKYVPVNVFVAENGWMDDNSMTVHDDNKVVEAPLLLDWFPTTSLLSHCNGYEYVECWADRSGYTCRCQYPGYDGNPYIPGGCRSVCDSVSNGCHGECFLINSAHICRCPGGTYGDATVEGGCVKYNFTTDTVLTMAAPAQIGLPNCSTTCGGVRVPYPFGFGPSQCFWPGFELICDTSYNPPKLFLVLGNKPGGFFFEKSTEGEPGDISGIHVVDISLRNSTVRVIHCPDVDSTIKGMEVEYALEDMVEPYMLSTMNELILFGCDLQATLHGSSNSNSTDGIITGCTSTCRSGVVGYRGARIPAQQQAHGRHCSGQDGCCHAPISAGSTPKRVEFKALNMNTSKNYSLLSDRPPAIALILEKGLTDQWYMILNRSYPDFPKFGLSVPLVLKWAIKQGFPVPAGNSGQCPRDVASRLCMSENSDCWQENGGFTCHCYTGYQGNPYIADGCQDINECNDTAVRNSCFGDCNNLLGHFECRCPRGTHGNAFKLGGCVRSPTGLIIGLSVASGAALLLFFMGGKLVLRKINQRRTRVKKQKYFKQNRGQLLQQLVSQNADIAERMIIPLDELAKATNNFDKARELGDGGHGTVYKGILSDLHVVAIKKSKIKSKVQTEIDEFINEVAILSQINHKNVVKLFGCCLETEVPLLVYEFVSNGTLYHHLHVEGQRSLSWGNRLRIATEIATSLAYLHSSVSVPIVHRDIKSSNILLDDTLTSKVSDFGASRYIQMDKTEFTSRIQGTFGYLDPECLCTGRLTEKSDVYSFGVILIELLTRKKPFSYLTNEGDSLVSHFVNLHAEGNLVQIIDPQVIEEGDKEIEEVVALAAACVNKRGEERPIMRQVEHTLERLWGPKKYKKHDTAIDELGSQAGGQRTEGSSRIYSLEQEMMMSASYPR